MNKIYENKWEFGFVFLFIFMNCHVESCCKSSTVQNHFDHIASLKYFMYFYCGMGIACVCVYTQCTQFKSILICALCCECGCLYECIISLTVYAWSIKWYRKRRECVTSIRSTWTSRILVIELIWFVWPKKNIKIHHINVFIFLCWGLLVLLFYSWFFYCF